MAWAGRRPIFSTVEKSVGIACPCAHTVGGGVGAWCGDRPPGFADLRKARSVLTYWRGRAGGRPIFSTVEKSVGIACPCAHTVGGGVGAWCGDRRRGLADLGNFESSICAHVLVRAGGDRFSRPSRKASASRALARTQTAGASEPSAVTGDAVSPTSEELDPCSRTGAGGAATDFLDRRETE